MATRLLKADVTDEWKAERVRLATDAINALIAFTAHEQHVADGLAAAARLLGHIAIDPGWQPYDETEEPDEPPFVEHPVMDAARSRYEGRRSDMFYATINAWLTSRGFESEPGGEIDRMVARGDVPADVLSEAQKHDITPSA